MRLPLGGRLNSSSELEGCSSEDSSELLDFLRFLDLAFFDRRLASGPRFGGLFRLGGRSHCLSLGGLGRTYGLFLDFLGLVVGLAAEVSGGRLFAASVIAAV